MKRGFEIPKEHIVELKKHTHLSNTQLTSKYNNFLNNIHLKGSSYLSGTQNQANTELLGHANQFRNNGSNQIASNALFGYWMGSMLKSFFPTTHQIRVTDPTPPANHTSPTVLPGRMTNLFGELTQEQAAKKELENNFLEINAKVTKRRKLNKQFSTLRRPRADGGISTVVGPAYRQL